MTPEDAPWVEDHNVLGMVIMPGTGMVELAVAAGRHAGTAVLDELVLEAPLIVHDGETVRLQVTVGAADEDGRREVAIYSHPETSDAPDAHDGVRASTCHGRGTLMPDAGPDAAPLAPSWLPVEWPPPGAEPIAVDAVYARLAEIGFDYGPAFQGLQAGWRDGDEVFAEVALPDENVDEARRFGLHPALFDASLHGGLDWLDRGDGTSASLPFSWAGVRCRAGRCRAGPGPDRAGRRVGAARRHRR